MPRGSLIAAAALLAVAGPALGTSAAWLDAPVPAGWNAPGAKIPRPPKFDPDPFLDERCVGEVRQPLSDADRAVAARGWKLMGAELSFGDMSVVVARSGVDGMCRPLGYQAFVFSGGKFAGTLAPRPMDARTDGSGQLPQLASPSELTVTYARYTAKDPLCCPSRLSTVRFRVDAAPGGPVVVPVSVATVATETPAAAGPVGRTWRLVRILMMDDTVLVPADPSRYTLRLEPDGRATVQADCNRGSATYALDGSALTFGPMATTRAMCPPGSMSDRYLAQLTHVASWVTREGKLHLATRADGAILEFDPAP